MSYKEERQHEVHEEGRKTGYTAMEGQRELHREDGRLQWNDVSVSYTGKTGDCNGTTSA